MAAMLTLVIIILTVTDSRNRQVVTSIVRPEAGTACSEDVVAHACRGMKGEGSKGHLPELRLRCP